MNTTLFGTIATTNYETMLHTMLQNLPALLTAFTVSLWRRGSAYYWYGSHAVVHVCVKSKDRHSEHRLGQ